MGLDGFNDDAERLWYENNYLAQLRAKYGESSAAYQNAVADPSNDNYRYYLGGAYDNAQASILNRYKRYNMTQGNSPTADQSTEPDYPTTATNVPDNEDINRDFTLNDIEEYYQYKVDINKNRLQVGQNYVTDSSVTIAT